MPQPTSELGKRHPKLFHYTTATGLEGILRSRTLWATHFAYLNDTSEFRGFRDPLADFLRPIARNSVDRPAQVPGNAQLIQNEGGPDGAAARIVKETTAAMFDTLFGSPSASSFAEPYVLSFCTASIGSTDESHGLLSQWRGYGKDGGYALVFDTDGVESLIVKEGLRWTYDHIMGGDVVYSNEPASRFQEEFGEHIARIGQEFGTFLFSSGAYSLGEEIYSALLLVCVPLQALGLRRRKGGSRSCHSGECRTARRLPEDWRHRDFKAAPYFPPVWNARSMHSLV